MIQAVVFDFGGVVVSSGFENWIQEYLPDKEGFHDKLAYIGPKVDRGTFPAKAYTDLFATITNKSSEEINTEILLSYEVNTDIVSFTQQLHKTVKTGLIANFPVEWFDYVYKKFHLDGYFDSVLVSGRIHVVKPEAKIYLDMLDNLHCKPEEAVFIDDNLPNVLGAKDIGMRGIHFTGLSSLLHDLGQLGVKV